MRVTVGICTWNRCKLLGRTLDALAAVRVPADLAWEVLVVDNGSTDETPRTVDAFAGRLPVRRLLEPAAGKSHALNRAAREAAGEYILWTDDDVLVDPGWIAAYDEAFRRHPDAAFFGGPIVPLLQGTPPAWLRQALPEIGFVYAERDLGPEPFPLDPQTLPYGANLAVRARDQRRFAYDPALGPRPGATLRGEETTLLEDMLAAGLHGWWVPGARVRHLIPRDRQTVKYLRDYFTGVGEQRVIRHRRRGAASGSETLWMAWLRAIAAEIRYRLRRLTARPATWVLDLAWASRAWGRLAAARAARVSRVSGPSISPTSAAATPANRSASPGSGGRDCAER